MLRALTSALCVSTVLAAGCGPSWPGHATMVADPAFARRTLAIGSVDVLPADLEVWTEPGNDLNLEQVRSTAEARILNAATAACGDRSLGIAAMIDWNGEFAGGAALAQDDLRATIAALAHYGAMVNAHPGQLPPPYLPAKLGLHTGADATLYVGGWGFVSAEHESTANKVAKGIAIALIVVAVVAVVVVAASELDKSSGHGHGHGGHGGAADGHDVRGGVAGDGVVDGMLASRSGGSITWGEHGHGGHGGGGHIATEVALDVVDAFGHAVLEDASHPEWSEEPDAPHGGDSKMYLEMTLVDNHTGLVLWHAHQGFPGNMADSGDDERAAHTLLASLPGR